MKQLQTKQNIASKKKKYICSIKKNMALLREKLFAFRDQFNFNDARSTIICLDL